MNNKIVTIREIEESIYDHSFDSEYREALGHSLMALEYVSDSPLYLHFGTTEQREEIKRVEAMPLDYNQISEIIHLMMYEMRNDFQYGRFKPIAEQYINISKEMEKEKTKDNNSNRECQKLTCNIYKAYGNMLEIIGLSSKTLKQNNMYDESRKMIERATLSYSYDEAFDIIGEYVELIKEQENEEEFE